MLHLLTTAATSLSCNAKPRCLDRIFWNPILQRLDMKHIQINTRRLVVPKGCTLVLQGWDEEQKQILVSRQVDDTGTNDYLMMSKETRHCPWWQRNKETIVAIEAQLLLFELCIARLWKLCGYNSPDKHEPKKGIFRHNWHMPHSQAQKYTQAQ